VINRRWNRERPIDTCEEMKEVTTAESCTKSYKVLHKGVEA
jgi:hypothetical protein